MLAVAFTILQVFVLILATLAILYYMGLRQRWCINRASGVGPTNLGETIAFHFILTTFKNFSNYGRIENCRRTAYHWVLRRVTLKNRTWERLMTHNSRFTWRVEMPVLNGAIELADGKRIEMLVPLRGAIDSDLRMFQFRNDGRV